MRSYLKPVLGVLILCGLFSIPSFAQVADNPPVLTISTELPLYDQGDTILVSGSITDLDVNNAIDITLRVVGPITSSNSGTIVSITQIKPNPDGSFENSIGIVWTQRGDYKIMANYGPNKAETTFFYTGETASSITNNAYVKTAKSYYAEGEAIVISGKADSFLPNTPLLIQVFHDAIRVHIAQVEVAQDGTFTYSLIADGPNFQTSGEYVVQMSYGVTGNVYETSFDFQTTDSNTNPTQIFEVNAGDYGTIDVPYVIQGGILQNIAVDNDLLGLIIDIRTNTDGSVSLDLPRTLIDAKKSPDGKTGDDDTYIIYVDGLEVPYQESSIKPNSRLVTIAFQEGSATIKIIGTTVVRTASELSDTDLPYSATVSIPIGSSSQGCENINRCYIPANVAIAIGGEVVWSNDDNASHTVTSGEGTSVDGKFDSSLFSPRQIFAHRFDEQGQFPYFCMVHPWMKGTVFVGQSASNPIPTPNPTPTPDIELYTSVDKSEYDLGELATLNVQISDVSSPQNVAITVTDPFGTVMVSRTLTTDSNGNASTDFKIAESFKTGTYRIDATSSIDGWTYIDDSEFRVTSQFNQIQIISAQGTDQQGNPMEFSRGSMGFVKVQVNAQKPIATLITVNVFDSDLTPLGVGSLKTTLNTGQSELILSFMIPQDAVVGTADIYVNALSDWVSAGGIPQTGEFAGQVRIN